MKIRLNNNEETFGEEKLTISQLLEIKKFTFKMLLVKVNEQAIRREHYDTTYIQDGDDVFVLHLMSGG